MLLTASGSAQLPHQNELRKLVMNGEARRHPELLVWPGALRVSIPTPGHETQGTQQRLGVTRQLLRVLDDFLVFIGRVALKGTAHKQKTESQSLLAAAGGAASFFPLPRTRWGSVEPSPFLSLPPGSVQPEDRHLTTCI